MHRDSRNSDMGAEVGVLYDGGNSDAELATSAEVVATPMWELRRVHHMPKMVETRS